MPPRRLVLPVEREVTFAEFMKTHPPAFVGGCDITKAINWLRSIETCFRLLRCPATRKVDFAGYMLQEDALEWWTGTKDVKFPEDDEVDWETFKVEFKEKYLPRHLMDELKDEFRSLSQGTLSVPEYATRFVRLERHFPTLCEDEEERTRKFIAGLDSSIKMQVMSARIKTLTEATALADSLEKEIKRSQSRKKPSDEAVHPGGGKKSKMGPNSQSQAVAITTAKPCSYCNKMHPNKPCYKQSGACYRCGGQGHFAKDCQEGRKKGAAQERPVDPSTDRRMGARGTEEQRRIVSARAFAITDDGVETTNEVITGMSNCFFWFPYNITES